MGGIFLRDPQAMNLCRPFIDFNTNTTSATTLNFYTDASLNKNFGMGGVFGSRWFSALWGKQFIVEESPIIEFLELFALVTEILIWGKDPRLVNTRVVIFCDNESVMNMVNNYSSGCMKCMKLLQILAFDGIKYNRRVFVKHVRSKSNVLADTLSRMKFRKFWRKAPEGMSQFPDPIPKAIWPIDKVWFS